MNVALFDYGAGNLHSLAKALERAGARVTVTEDWGAALAADALVLPGVGSFGAAVRALEGHEDRIREALESGMPALGICLGMQLLLGESDEASGRGIGLVPGRVRRLRASVVPQMGWNDVETGEDLIFTPGAGVEPGSPADPPGAAGLVGYYANSYVCDPEDSSCVIAWSEYEGTRYPAALRKANTWGFQFHPEKSSGPGVALIHAFVREARRWASVGGPESRAIASRPAEGDTDVDRDDSRGGRAP